MRREAAKKRILVIDDDERALISLECLLETEGYVTTTAWSGQEGLALLRSQQFDLVLLDDYLRDIEHEEIFEEIQRMEIQPLVILTETAPMSVARRHYFDLGASGVVSKWAPCEEIAAEIRKCFANTGLEAVSG
jgi:CheY-like chemotaxis protein